MNLKLYVGPPRSAARQQFSRLLFSLNAAAAACSVRSHVFNESAEVQWYYQRERVYHYR